MIKAVHVVYKTHLDLGFTDHPDAVIGKYLNDYIPKAMNLARDMERTGGEDRFIWTTGSWLIRHFLDHAAPDQRQEMVDAIEAGRIAWHGLPVSLHTELMDVRLAEYGLSIARELDAEFCKQTLAAKMTDVPGHTLGLVSLMSAAGLKYLHIGVNPASALPDVPPAFVWRASDGAEIVVNYDADYGAPSDGTAYTVPGVEHALYVAHTGDNTGPPTEQSVAELYAQIRKNYPEATVKASTLDAFAAELWDARAALPVVTEEIGDSWIHGAGSDPVMIQRLRELLRLRDQWLDDGRLSITSREYKNFSDNLLLIAEHTWGGDEKKFLPDFKNFAKADFQAARAMDRIPEGLIPDIHRAEAPGTPRSYADFELTWNEKRGYSDAAIAALPHELRAEAQTALDALTPRTTPRADAPCTLVEEQRLGRFTVTLGGDGSIVGLVDDNGKVWADPQNPIGAYSYETFGPADYQRWYADYCRDLATHHSWAVADFGKVGFDYAAPAPHHELFRPTVVSTVHTTSEDADVLLVHAVMPRRACQDAGAPRTLEIAYRFSKDSPSIGITLKVMDKDANRLPEASWFTVAPKVNNPNLWQLNKLGASVSPLNVVRNGNRAMHAVGSGMFYAGADGGAAIETLDAPLVAVGRPRLLHFDNTFADLADGFHINLHNNVWGTNFRMWFEEDMLYRFSLKLG